MSGKDVWTADVEELSREIGAAKKDSKSPEVNQFKWTWFKHQTRSYLERRIPKVTKASADLNGDAKHDIVVLCHKNPVLLALDGEKGKLMWRYKADPPLKEGQQSWGSDSGGLHSAEPIGDVDDDGVTDYRACFYSRERAHLRWLDVVSGKTGQRIWRCDMPVEWFDPGKQTLPAACQISFEGGVQFRHQRASGYCWQYRDAMAFRGQNLDAVVPLSLIHI